MWKEIKSLTYKTKGLHFSDLTQLCTFQLDPEGKNPVQRGQDLTQSFQDMLNHTDVVSDNGTL